MSNHDILVVDDEPDILELVRYNLHKAGFQVQTVSSGEEALSQASKQRPDLIVLDLMLPGIDGIEVCRALKGASATKDISILMLSARGEESDVVTGLELGADDYVTKPFSPGILTARVKAILRKRHVVKDDQAKIRIQDIVLDPARHELFVDGTPVSLTVTEFRLLHFLARQPGRVFTRYQIVDGVKGEDYPVTDRSVDVQVVGLRRKLGAHAASIETVRGVGYRFKD